MKNIVFTVYASFLCIGTFFSQNSSIKLEGVDSFSTTNCPYLTNDNEGNIVLSFGVENDTEESTFYYAFFNAESNIFGKIIEIESAKGVKLHEENAPKIAFRSDGTVVAVWGVDNTSEAKKYGGRIFYSQSFDKGKSWTEATPLVTDETSIDQRYFDIEKLSDGEIGIIWLDSRTSSKLQGSTLFFAATKGTLGFLNEKPIAETTCQCCRTDLFINENGFINVAFRDIINDEIRDMSICISKNNGKTFSKPKRISEDNWKINGCPHTGPTIAENINGLHFAWFTMGNGSGVYYCNSIDGANTFSKRESVSIKSSAKHPQITTGKNQHVYIVWDEINDVDGIDTFQVGLQERDEYGELIVTKFISDAKQNAVYPVIKNIQNDNLLIAWVNRDKPENVYYKIVKMTDKK
ncbi:hypothetical protein ACFSX9_12190 [Flavobacterium ardleyense]|uniref:Exo-alpha-sialidase n=1 Tax=Flavobacterium ardleyense TaxID=2038737 RepID=A0ABW5ZAF6_9FLAO